MEGLSCSSKICPETLRTLLKLVMPYKETPNLEEKQTLFSSDWPHGLMLYEEGVIDVTFQ